jgi:hypothetical protein
MNVPVARGLPQRCRLHEDADDAGLTGPEGNMRSAFANLSRRWSSLIAVAAVGVALLIAGCGGSPHSAASGAPAASSTAHAKAATVGNPIAGIAQHNAGDQDADNNGGPNDGDGAL